MGTRSKLLRTMTIAMLALLLLAGVGAVGYAQYRPERRDVLDGILPASFGNRITVAALHEPDRTRFTEALRAAVRGVRPGYRIDGERHYVHHGGYAWDAVGKISGARLRDTFGYTMFARDSAVIDGQGVDYLLWRPRNRVRRYFDHRVVAAVGLSTLLRGDSATLVFGYFALRPE